MLGRNRLVLVGSSCITELNDLDLVRKTPESLKWYLPKTEVKRAKQASGD